MTGSFKMGATSPRLKRAVHPVPKDVAATAVFLRKLDITESNLTVAEKQFIASAAAAAAALKGQNIDQELGLDDSGHKSSQRPSVTGVDVDVKIETWQQNLLASRQSSAFNDSNKDDISISISAKSVGGKSEGACSIM